MLVFKDQEQNPDKIKELKTMYIHFSDLLSISWYSKQSSWTRSLLLYTCIHAWTHMMVWRIAWTSQEQTHHTEVLHMKKITLMDKIESE